MKRAYIAIFLAIDLLIVDRALKWYSEHSLPSEGVFWIPNLFGLERYSNHGIAFSLPLDRTIILTATVVVVITLVQSILRHNPTPQTISALTFLVLGSASNFYDRVMFGYVIDYLRIGPISLINIADCMVVIGLIILILQKRAPLPSTHTH